MTRIEYAELTNRLSELREKRAKLDEESKVLKVQQSDCIKSKLLTGTSDSKHIAGIEKRLKEISAELEACDLVILEVQEQIDPVTACLARIRKEAAQLAEYRASSPQFQQYTMQLSPLHDVLLEKVRQADSLKLSLMQDDFQALDSEVRPIEQEIEALEARLRELRSNPKLHEHKKLLTGLNNLNWSIKNTELSRQTAANMFNQILREFTR